MSDITRLRVLLLALPLAFLAACSDTTAPVQVKPEADLHFLRPAVDAPPLVDSTVTFYAKKGTDREAHLYFQAPGGGIGEEYLRFRVDADALYRRPDGTPFAVGDSILITIHAADPSRMIVEFQPTGLKFNPVAPAELRLQFAEADKDYNDDGVVNSADTAVVAQFSIWRQESAAQPWVKIGSLVTEELEEVEGPITGFSNYAIAY